MRILMGYEGAWKIELKDDSPKLLQRAAHSLGNALKDDKSAGGTAQTIGRALAALNLTEE